MENECLKINISKCLVSNYTNTVVEHNLKWVKIKIDK